MLEVVEAGPLSIVQDLGRRGHEKFGIPRGGALDLPAFIDANRLVCNDDNVAGLECLLRGVSLRAQEPVMIATVGFVAPTVDGAEVSPCESVELPAGATLICGQTNGARGYIAVRGGFDVPDVLGSRATDLESTFGGFSGRALIAGDALSIGDAARVPSASCRYPHRPISLPLRLRVVPGPRFDDFTAAFFATFIGSQYTMSPQSNHVGIRLLGPEIESYSRGDRISEPMPIGGIQITPAGQPVILMNSRGTIGGYPVIATVITPDLWRVAQLRPGEAVTFEEVSMDRAQEITLHAYDQLERDNA